MFCIDLASNSTCSRTGHRSLLDRVPFIKYDVGVPHVMGLCGLCVSMLEESSFQGEATQALSLQVERDCALESMLSLTYRGMAENARSMLT